MPKTRIFIFLAMISIAASLWGQELPDWYTQLRDAVYSQDLSSRELYGLYNSAKEQAGVLLSGADLSVMLSRCEYMMARSLLYEGNKQDAAAYLERGLNYAQDALNQKASSAGWQMLAENISQLCTVRSVLWVMANGGKVEKYSQNALKLDPGNAAAQYLIAAKWVYAPVPFRNFNKGIQMMEAIIVNSAYYGNRLQKDDRFNVYSAIGYAFNQQKKNSDAKEWLTKALQEYPDNKFVGKMMAGIMIQS